MSWWDNKKNWIYKTMYNNHSHLWAWIKKFIYENDIESIIEIGAGAYSPVKPMVQTYTSIDLNVQLPDAIHEDFTTMDVSPFIKNYELLLAAAVIEHCEGYDKFLEQIVKVHPKYAIVTFFTGVNRKMEEIKQHKFLDQKIWRNKYSRAGISAKLDSLGLVGRYEFYTPGDNHKNDLVLITF